MIIENPTTPLTEIIDSILIEKQIKLFIKEKILQIDLFQVINGINLNTI